MSFLENIGKYSLKVIAQIGATIFLLIETLKKINKIKLYETCKQCLLLGVNSFPIVFLTLLFTGMVFSAQIVGELVKYGAEFTAGSIVAIGLGRELGPVLCGVVLAGRVGAAITAELGTMRVTEQIDALRCMAVDPVEYLVLPRVIACMIMLPILDVFAVTIGVGGGMIVASVTGNISSHMYWDSITSFCVASDLYIGMIKTVFFGMIIALTGCDRGITCETGAEGVGKATTQSVVYSMIMIFIVNYILSTILF